MNWIALYLIIFALSMFTSIVYYILIVVGLVEAIKHKDKANIITAAVFTLITSAILFAFVYKILVITEVVI